MCIFHSILFDVSHFEKWPPCPYATIAVGQISSLVNLMTYIQAVCVCLPPHGCRGVFGQLLVCRGRPTATAAHTVLQHDEQSPTAHMISLRNRRSFTSHDSDLYGDLTWSGGQWSLTAGPFQREDNSSLKKLS
jgi:hypothetical protein